MAVHHRQANGKLSHVGDGATLAGKNDAALKSNEEASQSANTMKLFICVGGIYASLYVILQITKDGSHQANTSSVSHGDSSKKESPPQTTEQSPDQRFSSTLL